MKSFFFLLLVLLFTGVSRVPSFAQSNNNQNSDPAEEKIYEPAEVDRSAKITYKAEPTYTEKARKNGVSGRVVLKVVLKSSGAIGDITVVKDLPDGLTEQCIRVARQIKFQPAIKDGRAVSQYLKAEYNFLFVG
jgi:TonB family protein